MAHPFIDKPSDAMMFFILFGCALFYLWVLMRGSHMSSSPERAGETDGVGADGETENEAMDEGAGNEGGSETEDKAGCAFIAQGYVLVVILMVIGVVLLSVFQALHPGQ